MCGEPVRGIPKLMRIEGAELQVCSRCERYGTEVQQPKRTDVRRAGAQPAASGAARPVVLAPVYRKRDMFDYMGGDIVEDYGVRIRKARMERGLSQKDLAMLMKEKELLVKKIEKGELIPEEDVRKKLEKVLEIHLLDAVTDETEKKTQSKITQTLGDLTIIRKVKK